MIDATLLYFHLHRVLFWDFSTFGFMLIVLQYQLTGSLQEPKEKPASAEVSNLPFLFLSYTDARYTFELKIYFYTPFDFPEIQCPLSFPVYVD